MVEIQAKAPDFKEEIETHRDLLYWDAADIATEMAMKDYEKITAILEKAGCDLDDIDAVYEAVLEATRIAFKVGCKLGGTVYQVSSACDSLLREYDALVQENGKG